MGYTIQVDEEKSYVLGLQQLVSKSASDTLESLKVILPDIDDICKTNIDSTDHADNRHEVALSDQKYNVRESSN